MTLLTNKELGNIYDHVYLTWPSVDLGRQAASNAAIDAVRTAILDALIEDAESDPSPTLLVGYPDMDGDKAVIEVDFDRHMVADWLRSIKAKSHD